MDTASSGSIATITFNYPPKCYHITPPKPKREKFTPDEDQIIRDFVKKYGRNKWNMITKYLPHKTPEACHTRYSRYISKEGTLNYTFTEEDDELIYKMRMGQGARWKDIAKHLKGKTCYMIKNRYSHIVHMKARKERPKKPHRIASLKIEGDTPTAVRIPNIEIEEDSEIPTGMTDPNTSSDEMFTDNSGFSYIRVSEKQRDKLPSILNLPFIDVPPNFIFSEMLC